MIHPRDALELVREQLRTEVLPHLDTEAHGYAHSVVVAALGVLREVSQRVVYADQWCVPSVTALRAAADGWAQHVADVPDAASAVSALIDAADAAASPGEARRNLLDAAEIVVETIWESPPGEANEALLREIRALLAADNRLENDNVDRPARGGPPDNSAPAE